MSTSTSINSLRTPANENLTDSESIVVDGVINKDATNVLFYSSFLNSPSTPVAVAKPMRPLSGRAKTNSELKIKLRMMRELRGNGALPSSASSSPNGASLCLFTTAAEQKQNGDMLKLNEVETNHNAAQRSSKALSPSKVSGSPSQSLDRLRKLIASPSHVHASPSKVKAASFKVDSALSNARGTPTKVKLNSFSDQAMIISDASQKENSNRVKEAYGGLISSFPHGKAENIFPQKAEALNAATQLLIDGMMSHSMIEGGGTGVVGGGKWTLGDVLFGKVSGHPWWPCMVAYDPLQPIFTKIKPHTNVRVYHVQFFGDEAERGWVFEKSTMPFEGLVSYERLRASGPVVIGRNSYEVKSNRFAAWSVAVAAAEVAYSMSRTERICRFTFVYEEPVVPPTPKATLKKKDVGEKRGRKRKVAQGGEVEGGMKRGVKRRKVDASVMDEVDTSGLDGDLSDSDVPKSNVKRRVSMSEKRGSQKMDAKRIKLRARRVNDDDGLVSILADGLTEPNGQSTIKSQAKRRDSTLSESAVSVVDSLESSRSLTADYAPGGSQGGQKGARRGDDVCLVCEGAGGRPVRCRGFCQGCYHASCLGLTEAAVLSPGGFTCDECSTGTHTCFACKARDNDATKCSSVCCGKFYHEVCLLAHPQPRRTPGSPGKSTPSKPTSVSRSTSSSTLSSVSTSEFTITSTLDSAVVQPITSVFASSYPSDNTANGIGVSSFAVPSGELSDGKQPSNVSGLSDPAGVIISSGVPCSVKGVHVFNAINLHSLGDTLGSIPSNDRFDSTNPNSMNCPEFSTSANNSASVVRSSESKENCVAVAKEAPDHADDLSSRKKQKKKEVEVCPLHRCATCVALHSGVITPQATKGRMYRCVRCPTAYHATDLCLAAGSVQLAGQSIVCSKHFACDRRNSKHLHVNVSWCFSCSRGGTLLCCETCPAAYHADCLGYEPTEGSWSCDECTLGKRPLAGEVVWVKIGHYRWWPGLICVPKNVPDNIQRMAHDVGEFPVMFFGTKEYNWMHQGRVFLFQDGDAGITRYSSGKHLTTVFNKGRRTKNWLAAQSSPAVAEAKEASRLRQEERARREEADSEKLHRKPPPYKRIKTNVPLGNVEVHRAPLDELPLCHCKPATDASGALGGPEKPLGAPAGGAGEPGGGQGGPCGPDADCINRLVMYECHPALCAAGDACENQRFQRRQDADTTPFRADERGWGLRVKTDITKGTFVHEYIGDLIDEAECRRRLEAAHRNNVSNFYMLTLDKNRIIDAGPKGNNSRFMNHSCAPNCETQKWSINGDIRIGLFALTDIPAGTELTFNYNLDCYGDEKTVCKCGASTCSGFIGVRPKIAQDATEKRQKKKPKRTRALPAAGTAAGAGATAGADITAGGGTAVLAPRCKHESECFRCGAGGELVQCDLLRCTKAYHLACLQLTQLPGGKWLCPWHHCNESECDKRAQFRCVRCPSSFCRHHAPGHITDTPGVGLLCHDHGDDDEAMMGNKQREIKKEQCGSTDVSHKATEEQNEISADKVESGDLPGGVCTTVDAAKMKNSIAMEGSHAVSRSALSVSGSIHVKHSTDTQSDVADKHALAELEDLAIRTLAAIGVKTKANSADMINNNDLLNGNVTISERNFATMESCDGRDVIAKTSTLCDSSNKAISECCDSESVAVVSLKSKSELAVIGVLSDAIVPDMMLPISPKTLPNSPKTLPISPKTLPISPKTLPISPKTLPISPLVRSKRRSTTAKLTSVLNEPEKRSRRLSEMTARCGEEIVKMNGKC